MPKYVAFDFSGQDSLHIFEAEDEEDFLIKLAWADSESGRNMIRWKEAMEYLIQECTIFEVWEGKLKRPPEVIYKKLKLMLEKLEDGELTKDDLEEF